MPYTQSPCILERYSTVRKLMRKLRGRIVINDVF